MIVKVWHSEDSVEAYIDLSKVAAIVPIPVADDPLAFLYVVIFEGNNMDETQVQSLEKEKDLVKLWKMSKVMQELPADLRGE